MESMDKVKKLLIKIYGEETGTLAFERIVPVIKKYTVKESW